MARPLALALAVVSLAGAAAGLVWLRGRPDAGGGLHPRGSPPLPAPALPPRGALSRGRLAPPPGPGEDRFDAKAERPE